MSYLVLDTSAVIAYATGSVHGGEPMAEVYQDGGRVLIPVVCLIEAARHVGDDMPKLLTEDPACEVVPLAVESWPVVTSGVRVLGRLDLSIALLTATSGGGYVLTSEPESYGDPDQEPVIPL